MQDLAIQMRFSEALLGLIAALGANAPEITSSIFSIYMGQHEIGFGIIIGSNIINIAGILGINALIVGQIRLGIPSLIFNGGMSLFITLLVTFFIFDWVSIDFLVSVLSVFILFYVYLICKRSFKVKPKMISRRVWNFLHEMVKDSSSNIAIRKSRKLVLLDLLFVMISLFAIVMGSSALVLSSIDLAQDWGISHAVLGTLILAGLTSVPNIVTSIFLAKKGLGSAVVSEAFNSNMLNFATGICVPVLLFGMGKVSTEVEISSLWLLGMTILAISGLSFRKGLGRLGGVGILILYLCYASFIIF